MAGTYETTLLVVCLFYFGAVSGGRVARDVSSLDLNLGSLADNKDAAEVQKTLQDNSNTLAAKLEELSAQLKEQMSSATGSVQKVFEDASARMGEAVNKLKSNVPTAGDIQDSTKQLGENLKSSLESAVAESRRVSDVLAKNAQGVDSTISDTFKSYYEQLAKAADSLRGQNGQAA